MPWPQPYPRQRRRRDLRIVVGAHRQREVVRVVAPLLGADTGHVVRPPRHDLLVATADEVPPHDDVLVQRLTPDDDRPHDVAGVRVGAQPQLPVAGRAVAEHGLRDLDIVEVDRAGVGQHPELPALVDVDHQRIFAGEPHLRADHRRIDGDRRIAIAELADEDRHLVVVDPHRFGGEVLEMRADETGRLRQRGPQLDAVQRLVGLGVLGVGDTPARGHQVHLAGPDNDVAAQRILVPDLAAEQPGDRLQAGVRMTRDPHRVGARPEMVEETPTSDQAERPLRQDPADLEAVTGAERDETGMYDLDVAHRPSMACADRARGVRRWRSSGPRPWPGGPPGPSPGRPAMAVFGSMTLAWWPAQT